MIILVFVVSGTILISEYVIIKMLTVNSKELIVPTVRMVKQKFNPTKIAKLSMPAKRLVPREKVQDPRLCWRLPLLPVLRITGLEIPTL